MSDVFEKIIQWAHDRNLIEGSTPKAQMLKLVEECGEVAEAMYRSDIDGVRDGVGDCIVVLTILLAQYGLNCAPVRKANVLRAAPMIGAESFSFAALVAAVGQIASNIARGKDAEEVADNIHDAACALYALCEIVGLHYDTCVESAYNEIKDRKGRMVDGVFIKEADNG